MYPTETQYWLATSASEYRLCHALQRAAERPEVAFGYPTVLAVRGEALVGFLGTLKAKKAIVAGPLVVDPTLKRPVLTMLRLVEAYEEVLRASGVSSYVFGIDSDNLAWREIVHKRGYTPYAMNAQGTWYIKKVSQ